MLNLLQGGGGLLQQTMLKKVKQSLRENNVSQLLVSYDPVNDEATFEKLLQGEERVIISASDLKLYQDAYKQLHNIDNGNSSTTNQPGTGESEAENTGIAQPESDKTEG